MTALLRVEGLTVSYGADRGAVRAVEGVSFALKAGEAMGIVGESGSGKSSLGLGLMRLLPRNTVTHTGIVELEGADCMAMDHETFRREVLWRKIAMVFQGAMEALNPVLRVGDQVVEPLLLHADGDKRQLWGEVAKTFEGVGLPVETIQRYPHELSGGMKQRVLVAMALVAKPRLLILDEPTSALDVSVQAQIMNLLKSLKKDLDLGILFITHDIALATDLCDTIGVMYGGRLVELGPAETVVVRPSHPYTQLLLASIPRLHDDERPRFIPGSPPDLVEPPAGCKFHPRCPYAFTRCKEEEPPLIATGADSSARCWLVERTG